MQITILTENSVSHHQAKDCLAEWGLSLLIDFDGFRILLDTGHTELWWRNAEKMGIDLQTVDCVALSHYHWDHVGGLRFQKFEQKKPLICHPAVVEKVHQFEKSIILHDFDTQLAADPVEFLPKAFFLGEIPRITAFEPGMYKNDQMADDSALAFKTQKGVIVVTGCSHSGICNICEQAKKVTGKKKLLAVIGGFHLSHEDQEIVTETMQYFQKQRGVRLFPMHCVDFETMVAFRNVFNIESKMTGDLISF